MPKRHKKNQSVVSEKFLRPEQIDEALRELADLARDQDQDIALAGGVAMQLYGSDRFTKDVDIVADMMLDGLDERGPLSFGGMEAYTPAGYPVDVILRDDEYQELYEEALQSAQRIRGVPMRVVTPPYIAAMKFAAHRGKDLDDLTFLILEKKADLKKTHRIVSEILGPYAGREFDAFVDQVTTLGRRP